MVSVAEGGLQRLRMSWEEFLALPDDVRAEWVDGEVVVSPPVGPDHGEDHGEAAANLIHLFRSHLAHLVVYTEVGVLLAANRLRAPDVKVVERWVTDQWVTDPPVLVVEVLSPSTRNEDTVRTSPEYAAAGVGQLWLLDPEARALDVFEHVAGSWERLLRLDDATPAGEVAVGEHGTVPLDLRGLLPAIA